MISPYKGGQLTAKFLDWLDILVTKINNPAWQTPTLLNSWSNLPGEQSTRFRKNLLGEVEIQGVVELGTTTSGTEIFQLPAGHFSGTNLRFVVDSNGSHARVDVTTTGGVAIMSGTNTALNLTGIRFYAG